MFKLKVKKLSEVYIKKFVKIQEVFEHVQEVLGETESNLTQLEKLVKKLDVRFYLTYIKN